MNLVETEIDVVNLIKSFNYTLYAGRLAVKEIEIEKTDSGLYIPENSKDSEMKTNEGYVISIGAGVDFCKIADRVLYGRYSGAWFNMNGEKYRIMNERDLIAVKNTSNEVQN